MNNIIKFPNSDIKEYRQKCCFRNRAVQVQGEDGDIQKYPCIVLYEEETDIPIFYTGLERYLCHLVKSEMLNGKTLSAKAYAVCHFLNYIIKETDINSLHECTLDTIRGFLRGMREQEDGTEYNKATWLRYRDYVMDFLLMYYIYNKEALPFRYRGEDLKSLTIVKDEKSHKKATIVYNA